MLTITDIKGHAGVTRAQLLAHGVTQDEIEHGQLTLFKDQHPLFGVIRAIQGLCVTYHISKGGSLRAITLHGRHSLVDPANVISQYTGKVVLAGVEHPAATASALFKMEDGEYVAGDVIAITKRD